MDIIIGLSMLGFFAYLLFCYFFIKDFEPDPRFYAQLGVSGVGFFYLLIIQNLNKVKDFMFKFYRKKDMDKNTDKNIDLPGTDEKEFMDYQCLVYLKKRAEELKSKEALDLVVKLNTLLFSSGKQIT
jgi:hypothetical protein